MREDERGVERKGGGRERERDAICQEAISHAYQTLTKRWQMNDTSPHILHTGPPLSQCLCPLVIGLQLAGSRLAQLLLKSADSGKHEPRQAHHSCTGGRARRPHPQHKGTDNEC